MADQITNNSSGAPEDTNNPIMSSFDQSKLRELIRLMEKQQLSSDPVLSKRERDEAAEQQATHEFWNTQPVPKSIETIQKDGPLHPPLKPEEIRQAPYALPEGMVWCELDIERDSEMTELHELLLNHYVEDSDSMFRFSYSAEFLRWALMPPGFSKLWHVGVREAETGVLLAFISGIPVDVMVRDRTMGMAEINFLCLHKSLRSQRLAPLLIKEVTRRVHQVGIFQAIYTAGRLLPKPVSTCRYFHRTLNPRKLMDTGFSKKLEGVQLLKLQAALRLPAQPGVAGLRAMRKGDVGQVRKLLNRQLKTRCEVAPVFKTDAEIAHWFLPRQGVVWTYVVEDAEHPGRVTDFVSFYSLPSSVLKAPSAQGGSGVRAKGVRKPPGAISKTAPQQQQQQQHAMVNAAYLFYYGTKTDYDVVLTAEEKAAAGGQKKEKALVKERVDALIKERLTELMRDALVMASAAQFDVFNCLDMMDNAMFTSELRFGPGDGFLRYYFFNYMARNVDASKVGFVMV